MDATLEPVHKFRYQVRCDERFSENEIDQVFVGFYEGEVIPNPDEVSEYEWVSWEQLLQEGKSGTLGEKSLVPWLLIMLDLDELIEKLNQRIEQPV